MICVWINTCYSSIYLHLDYSELPPLAAMTNGPRDHAAEDREEEENGYDFPKSRLPLPPARRTLSELTGSSSSSSSSCSSSTTAFSHLSLESDAGAAACKCILAPLEFGFNINMTSQNNPSVIKINTQSVKFSCFSRQIHSFIHIYTVFLCYWSSICCYTSDTHTEWIKITLLT